MAQATTSRSDRCPACGRRQKRSTEQNRRYWALLAAVAEQYHPDGQTFSVRAWHLQARAYWLGCEDVKLPDGRVMTEPNSTADLDLDDFSDYMTKLEAWAANRGVFLSE